MDKTALGKEASEEVTRELLISIAYCLPEKVNAPTENLVEGIDSDCDGTEKYRSELISISDLQSPDSKGLPVMLGDIKD